MAGAARFAGRVAVGLVKLVAVLVSLVIVALTVLGAVTTQRGWPTTSGTVSVPGLEQPVTVLRDRHGIVQILADSTHDLFMAQGYVHAQERMWQMELSRRIGAGRLSELFGESQVETDRYIRTLGWRVAAQRDVDAMSTLSKFILQSYSDGVNAWITEHKGRLPTPFVVAGVLSGTYDIGGYALEPWTPLDTATWQKVQAWSLGGNADSEIFRLLADERLGDPALTDELFPAYPDGVPVITPTDELGEGGGAVIRAEPAARGPGSAAGSAPRSVDADATGSAPIPSTDHRDALVNLGKLASGVAALAGFDRGEGLVGSHGVGSNNWVVSGSRTAGGKPILANDPHLGFGMPSIWFMNGLHCRTITTECPWDVVGVSFPGAPAVVLGHNGRIAWGATNVNPDTQDLFLEAPDPSDEAGRYLYQGASVPYELRHEVIKVAGGADVEFDVRISRHGPILSDVDERLKDGPVLALRWTTTAEVDLALETFIAINRARTFEEFRAAFADYGSPSQNFIYADVEGNIGYVLPGRIPIRPSDCPDDAACRGPIGGLGDRVRDGQSGEDEWQGYVPFEELPWQLNPAGGRIVSANNAPVDGEYGYRLGNEFDPGYRAARIESRLAEIPGGATPDDMLSIQLDDYLGRADIIVPRLLALGVSPSTDDGRTLWGRIAQWDRRCDVGSTGCAAYAAIELSVMRAIFDDELGPIAREYVGSVMSWQALIAVLGDTETHWWQRTAQEGEGTPPVAVTPAQLVALAVDDLAAAMRESYGDPSGWTWGRLHTVEFRESTLGSSGIPPLEWYFNAGARPVAGADGAVLNNYYRVQRAYPDPDDPTDVPPGNHEVFGVTNGPSYRLVIDMADIDGARIVITTGQSGNVGDPHYNDLVPLWAEGQTIPLPFSPGNVQASAVQTLTLAP